jgi:hypothetical protein
MSDEWHVGTWMETRGLTAYMAYASAVDHKTHDGRRTPKWDSLSGTQRAAWTMAALAAVEQHRQETT